jgi:cruciform cutting endonuclease 1
MAPKALPTVSPVTLLASQKVSQLTTLLARMGLRTSGRKAGLVARAEHSILTTRASLSKAAANENATRRIISIDMGIRNLAICAANVHDSHVPRSVMQVHVTDWKRIDVLPADPASAKPGGDKDDQYSPMQLSRTAYSLVTSTILPLCSSAPGASNTILIERQRFRTSGAQAVQEWTLRVNVLEAMFFAILRSLHGSNGQNQGSLAFDVESISPSRVARYWFPEKKKVEKKDKIELVRHWMSDQEIRAARQAGHEDTNNIKLKFSSGVSQSFETKASGKKDDLADSLMQGVAWTAWLSTRKSVASMDEEELAVFLDDTDGF